ncbi:glycosyltransferase [Burkholderia multivorans]|uniref:glycosyltransferase family 2 protein n=1 Tax=Burkholderia multivorans TaxID=87883 RepID=UPI0011B23D97|nr:glycosyltransferase [Burkholderia multivorans]MBU9152859.1 glycosyltransferase [Burkholderia multivorans]MBU9486473.1 glycosyltransferase [Burkholderia multivorans]MCO8315773.1 glycosyltransferase [Burkholderia multivorans]MCO8430267.1 glycosyltransferase [Burkholderia multivorans]MCO8439787.1 glycosyltransferase [Burkholderia multivorans]
MLTSGRALIASRLAAVARAVRQRGVKGALRKVLHVVRRDAHYQRWVALYDTLDADVQADLERMVASLTKRPLISIVVPVYNAPAELLSEMIESVRAQIYPHWQLCIADDASPAPHIRRILEEYRDRDTRIRVVFREHNGHICRASNSALEIATGEFVALLDHDDVLPRHALAVLARYIDAYPNGRLFYSDEDKISTAGRRSAPYFKAEWDPELILQQNFFSHLGVYEAGVIRAAGGFRPGFEGSQDHDLVLRCARLVESRDIIHIPHVLYHWRTIEGSTAVSVTEKPYAVTASVKAVSEHLRALGKDAVVVPPSADFPFMRVEYPLPERLPVVHLVLLALHGSVDDRVANMVSLLEATSYGNLRITLVAELSAASLPAEWATRVELSPADDLNEIDSRLADGDDVVCVCDVRMTPMNDCWLRLMVEHALQPDVGLVGPAWFARNGSVSAVGLTLASSDLAVPVRPGDGIGDFGYFGWLGLTRTVSALSAGCVATQSKRLRAAGGLRITREAAWSVDLSLRMNAIGARNLVVPRAAVYDDAGEYGRPVDLKLDGRWSPDRRYSPNLNVTGSVADFDYACPPRIDALV